MLKAVPAVASLSLPAVEQNGCIQLAAARLFGRVEGEGGHEDKDTGAN
jgi:hypothetical protein